jgi:hypothetical protein
MTDQDQAPALPVERRLRFDWVFPALFRPRATFATLAAQAVSVWLAPLLLLTIVAVARSVAGGTIQKDLIASAQIAPPPDLPPEQVQTFQQAQSVAANPLFIYVFPSVLAVAGVWIGWLLVGGLLHLLLTLIGGRGSTRSALNVVAWASLPFVLRDLLRAGYMLASHSLIGHPGLAGFAPEGAGALNACALAVFGQVDLYLIWQIALIGLGVRVADQLPRARAITGAVVTVLLVMGLRAVPGTLAALIGAVASGRGF